MSETKMVDPKNPQFGLVYHIVKRNEDTVFIEPRYEPWHKKSRYKMKRKRIK